MESTEKRKIFTGGEVQIKNYIPVQQKYEGPSLFMKDNNEIKAKVISIDEVEARDVNFLPRESPDGSSDSSDWQTACSVSCPTLLIENVHSQKPNISSTSISRLVQGGNSHIVAVETGARPKEESILLKGTGEKSADSLFLSADDNVIGAGSSISPSLLKVNYGGECTTSDGDSSSAHCIQRSSGRQAPRGVQLRHRGSSGRLITFLADSDQESEDNIVENTVQISRRRRRTVSSQHHPEASVKALGDSRGVLDLQGNPQNITSADYVRNMSGNFRDINNPQNTIHSSGSSLHTDSANPITGAHTTPHCPTLQVTSNTDTVVGPSTSQAHVTTPPISANLLTDSGDGVAFSAPERNAMLSVLPLETTKTKKKTHGRSRSDGSEELISKMRMSQSSTVPYLESELDASKLFAASTDLGTSVSPQIRKRFMEDGGHSITPAADNGFFPRPEPGQSLIGFLSSKGFHKQYAELDRENAHFNISEAVIAALTQVR